MARVLIADDAEDLRRLLVLAIRRDGRHEVVAEAEDGRQAVDAVDRLAPDVVLMDLAMPVMDGLAATREIKRSHPDLPVLVFTGYADDRLAQEARDVGADGFMDKSQPLADVLDAICALTTEVA